MELMQENCHGCWGQCEYVALYCQFGQSRVVAMRCGKQCNSILSCPWHYTSTYKHTSSDKQQLSLNSTNGTVHFPCTQHEHQTSHMWTTMRKHIVHTIGTANHSWACLMTLSSANIVQHWCQLNEAWVWSIVGLILTWENWSTQPTQKKVLAKCCSVHHESHKDWPGTKPGLPQ
jgi:hypothetical protein